LKNDVKPIVNRKERIQKHLASCKHFLVKYGKAAEEILRNCDINDKMLSTKHRYIDG